MWESKEGHSSRKACLVDFPGGLVVSAPVLGYFFFADVRVSGADHMLLGLCLLLWQQEGRVW